MSTRDQLSDLEHWIGRMLECSAGPESESTLLSAIQHCLSAQAVALWRELTGPVGTRWVEVRARGPEELLPGPAQVRAVVEAGLDGELGERARVLRAGPRGAGIALALGGVAPTESGVDRAEALLAVYVDLAPPDAGRATVAAALPRRQRPARTHDPLSAARRIIAAEAALFANRSIELETHGFGAEHPRSALDEEQLAALVDVMLLRALRCCEGADGGPYRVVLAARACGGGLALSLETSAEGGPLRAARQVAHLVQASVRRAAGTLDCERVSERFERIRVWIPNKEME